MLIVCEHCQRQLTLPDEKVPPRPFALNCPGCQNRLQIDPANPPGPPLATPAPAPPAAEASPPEASPAESAPTTSSAPAASESSEWPTPPSPAAPPSDAPRTPDGFINLPPLHGMEKKLLAGLYPTGAVANLSGQPLPWIENGLKMLGVHEVSHFDEMEATVQAMEESRVGVLAIAVEKASAPPFPVLDPLYKLPLDLRRRTFVALLAENVRSLDGMVAFFLQVNCLINSKEWPKYPRYLQQAVLFHLRQYRHWGSDEG